MGLTAVSISGRGHAGCGRGIRESGTLLKLLTTIARSTHREKMSAKIALVLLSVSGLFILYIAARY